MQVVEISLQQQLYDALIHVHNRGLHDYSTPLLELLLQLRAAVKKAGKTLSSELKEGGEGDENGGGYEIAMLVFFAPSQMMSRSWATNCWFISGTCM